MLRVEEISKSYDGKQVLSSVTFQVSEGLAFALLGENGTGKSTLLRILSGIEKPDSGTVYYQNNSILGNRSFLRQHLGYVPQNPVLDTDLTVSEQLCLWRAACGCRRDIESETLMGLDSLMKCRVRTLSGGQCQRVSIAMALMNRPSILLMDEATTGLDHTYAEALLSWLSNYLGRGGILIWSTHHVNEVRRLCKFGLHLNDGPITL